MSETATNNVSRKRKESSMCSTNSSVRAVEPKTKKPKLRNPNSNGSQKQDKDFRMPYSTCYRDHEMKKIKKRNEKCSAELPPSMPKKPLFPNFVDPVPPNHKFAFEKKADKRSDEISTSSQSHGIKEKKEAEILTGINNELESPVIDDEVKTILIILFKNLCPKVIFNRMGCNEVACNFSHNIPNAKHLESQLLKRSPIISDSVYKFVLKFPLDMRNRFLPAFVGVEKRNENSSFELPPFMPKKPLFPNFVDPVPPNHKFAYEMKADKRSDELATSSQSHGIKEINEAGILTGINNELESPVIDNEVKLILIIFFKNLCPKVIFKRMGCNEVTCNSSHEIPDSKHLESQLLKRSLSATHTVYNFVLKFPLDLRNRFFPAFVEVGVKRNQESLLKKLMIDCLEMKRLDGFTLFLDVMERHSWTKQKAIKFLISHLDGSESALDEIARVVT